MNWNEYFIRLADLVSKKSKDTSTKVGCVIVSSDNNILSTGYNDFARGVKNLDERSERPEKYNWVVHSEANAVFNAARHGIKLAGSRMFQNYSPCACQDCANAIIQAGIIEVIGPDRKFPGKGEQWQSSVNRGYEKLREAGVFMSIAPGIEL